MSKKTTKSGNEIISTASISDPAVLELLAARQIQKEAEVLEHFKNMLLEPIVDTNQIQDYLDEACDGKIFKTQILLVIKRDGTINPVSLPLKFREVYTEVERLTNLEKVELIAELKGKETHTDAEIIRLVELDLSNPFKSKFKKPVAA